MKQYHLFITFVVSLLLHALLLLFFLQSNLESFKKGVGENPKIKISSFQVASFDAQASIPPSSPSVQKNTSNNQRQKIPKHQNTRSLKEKGPLKQESQQESNNQPNQQNKSESTPQNPTALKEERFEQVLPRTPIEQSLSYQLADAQTKQNIQQFYGAEFGQLGLEEQEYLLNNLAYIGRITQHYLRYPPNAGMLAQSGGNVIEFYLHPNGDISDLKIIKQSGFILLDRNSIKTIEIAYKDYPHPKTKTLIRFYINYYLR